MKEYISPQNGIYYRVNDFKPQRQTLVFIHGLIGSSSTWFRYEKRFENEFNILTFDLRGHGMSKKYPKEQDYTIKNFSKDIYELINELSIKRFVLITHSFGTSVALEFLREHANLVTSAIFFNPVYKKKMLPLFIFFVSWLMPLAQLLPPRKGGHVDYSQFINTGDFNMRRIFADIFNTTLPIYIYCLKQIAQNQDSNIWTKFSLPVFVVHGKKDKISPVANGMKIAQMIPGAKVEILENANHLTIFNNFDEVSEAIERFVSRSRPSAKNASR